MRRIPRWLWAILAILALAILAKLTILRTKPVTVEASKADMGPVEETITNTRAGTVKARYRAKLSPQIGGRVTGLPFAKGARVRSGDLLLQIDDSVQKAHVRVAQEELRTAEARVQEACLAADLAESDWRRGQKLEKDSILSAQSLETLKNASERAAAACTTARRALDQARAYVEMARSEEALTRIYAPFAGILADRSTEVGEWITPSPPGVPIPAVLDLLDPTSLYVSAPIDELDAARVQPGQEVRVTLDSFPGKTFPGKVARVAPYVLDVQEQNRTLEVEVEFAGGSTPGGLLPGTSADAEVILSRRDRVLRVPTSAIAEGRKVLVVVRGRLEERSVKVGLSNWRHTEVTEGVEDGDWVVTARESASVKDGARAEIRDAQ